MTLSASHLRSTLSYDPESGQFRRLNTRNKNFAGKVAGGKTHDGYVAIEISGIQYRAHRLAHLYMTGEWPKHQIDHINGIRDDNRWENLRDVPWEINAQNQRQPTRNNKTGFLGVCLHDGRFRAQIRVRGEKVRLGLFDTPEDAHAAYLAAKRKYHEGCTI